jgi:signal transduction histidine kinase/ActR/RegA family two-component response regulator
VSETTTSAVSRVTARMRGVPLGVRLVLLSVAITILVVGAAFLALRARVQRDVSRVFATELEYTQRRLSRMQDRNRDLLLATASLVSTSPTLRAALQTYRVETNAGVANRADLLATIQREIQRTFADIDSDLLLVTDEDGRILAGLGRSAAPLEYADLMTLPAVRHALQAEQVSVDSSFGLLRPFAGASAVSMQVACVAIVVAGFPIGVLVLGQSLDELMPVTNMGRGTYVILTVGTVVSSSTLPDVRAGQRWEPPIRLNASDVQRTRMGDDEYVVAALSLGLAEGGLPARLHVLRSLGASLQPVRTAMSRNFLIFGMLAVLLAGIGAAGMARRGLRPLARFVSFMRTGAEAGAYTRFAAGPAPAEIATLTDAYNRLIGSLGSKHAQLERRTNELASANVALRGEVEERERAEIALKESEEQLRQSQKLEALGTLAGGVAHDFNNLLFVIMGYAQFVQEDLPPESPQREPIDEIMRAGERASGLVRQLLAFSRKQVLQPQILDLNHVVAGMETLLRRLIGEDVELHIRLTPTRHRIMADRGQVEQVLMNLVVNARDAMPTGGTITVEIDNVQLDANNEVVADGSEGCDGVLLSVSDTGVGMDAATIQRVFEPFFTTKGPEKGTGLGLSTVYGIVKQSGGSITVASEPGEGCTFRICFVAVAAQPEAEVVAKHPVLFSGAETVLIAEDDVQVRTLVRRSLAARGYVVLEGSNGQEALDVAEHHNGPIHMLVSDVVMPNFSGIELAQRLRESRPGMHVLFMSGHSDEAIQRYGILGPRSTFVQKPIMPDTLAQTVRELLDADRIASGV